jgi:hypothetical protein
MLGGQRGTHLTGRSWCWRLGGLVRERRPTDLVQLLRCFEPVEGCERQVDEYGGAAPQLTEGSAKAHHAGHLVALHRRRFGVGVAQALPVSEAIVAFRICPTRWEVAGIVGVREAATRMTANPSMRNSVHCVGRAAPRATMSNWIGRSRQCATGSFSCAPRAVSRKFPCSGRRHNRRSRSSRSSYSGYHGSRNRTCRWIPHSS